MRRSQLSSSFSTTTYGEKIWPDTSVLAVMFLLDFLPWFVDRTWLSSIIEVTLLIYPSIVNNEDAFFCSNIISLPVLRSAISFRYHLPSDRWIPLNKRFIGNLLARKSWPNSLFSLFHNYYEEAPHQAVFRMCFHLPDVAVWERGCGRGSPPATLINVW